MPQNNFTPYQTLHYFHIEHSNTPCLLRFACHTIDSPSTESTAINNSLSFAHKTSLPAPAAFRNLSIDGKRQWRRSGGSAPTWKEMQSSPEFAYWAGLLLQNWRIRNNWNKKSIKWDKLARRTSDWPSKLKFFPKKYRWSMWTCKKIRVLKYIISATTLKTNKTYKHCSNKSVKIILFLNISPRHSSVELYSPKKQQIFNIKFTSSIIFLRQSKKYL